MVDTSTGVTARAPVTTEAASAAAVTASSSSTAASITTTTAAATLTRPSLPAAPSSSVLDDAAGVGTEEPGAGRHAAPVSTAAAAEAALGRLAVASTPAAAARPHEADGRHTVQVSWPPGAASGVGVAAHGSSGSVHSNDATTTTRPRPPVKLNAASSSFFPKSFLALQPQYVVGKIASVCVYCKQTKLNHVAFSKSQRRQPADTRRCNECVARANTMKRTLQCAQCKVSYTSTDADAFSKKQRHTPAAKRRCVTCIAAKQREMAENLAAASSSAAAAASASASAESTSSSLTADSAAVADSHDVSGSSGDAAASFRAVNATGRADVSTE
jgi:hypothetical protein